MEKRGGEKRERRKEENEEEKQGEEEEEKEREEREEGEKEMRRTRSGLLLFILKQIICNNTFRYWLSISY